MTEQSHICTAAVQCHPALHRLLTTVHTVHSVQSVQCPAPQQMITTLGAGDRDGIMVVVSTIQGDSGHIILSTQVSSSDTNSEHIFVYLKG